MTDAFKNDLHPGDKIIFGQLVKSGYNSFQRSPLQTGIIDHISKTGNYCYVPNGPNKFFRLSSEFVLKYDYPYDL